MMWRTCGRSKRQSQHHRDYEKLLWQHGPMWSGPSTGVSAYEIQRKWVRGGRQVQQMKLSIWFESWADQNEQYKVTVHSLFSLRGDTIWIRSHALTSQLSAFTLQHTIVPRNAQMSQYHPISKVDKYRNESHADQRWGANKSLARHLANA